MVNQNKYYRNTILNCLSEARRSLSKAKIVKNDYLDYDYTPIDDAITYIEIAKENLIDKNWEDR